jgi:hypothetical protein
MRVVFYPLLATAIGAFSACGGQDAPYHKVKRILSFDSDPRLSTIVDEFIHKCDLLGEDCTGKSKRFPALVVKWDDSLDLKDSIAQCQIYGGDYEFKRIIVVHPYAKKYTEVELKNLVFHESAHCILRRDHTEDDVIDIMRPIMLSEQEIEEAGGLDYLLERTLRDKDAKTF